MEDQGKERKNYYVSKDVLKKAEPKAKKDGVPSMSWLVTRLLDMYSKGEVKPLG